MGSKSSALLRLSRNLDTDRALREPQLLILGEPKSGKTTFLDMYRDLFTVYNVPSRRDDFSGMTNDEDLWIIDEFTVDMMTSRILNQVLDSQRVRLDAKYGHTILKTKNVPVILPTHKLSYYHSHLDQKAFHTRVLKGRFSLEDWLEKDRFVSDVTDKSIALPTSLTNKSVTNLRFDACFATQKDLSAVHHKNLTNL